MDKQTVSDLVKLMRDAKKTDRDIVDVLTDMIKNQMLMGGSLQDRIDYQIDIIKRFTL